jgi:hypothetical protein
MADEGKKVLTPREARQGLRGQPVLVVLVISLVLVAVVWIFAELWGQSTQPVTPGDTNPPATNQTQNPGAQGGGAFDNNPPSGSKPASEGVDRSPTPAP